MIIKELGVAVIDADFILRPWRYKYPTVNQNWNLKFGFSKLIPKFDWSFVIHAIFSMTKNPD